MTAPTITGIVLAAGAGRRLGRPKADLDFGGQRLVDRAVGTLRSGGCGEVLAVLRPGQAAAEGARTVVNPEPDRGMGSSLRCALAELEAEPGSAACVVLLVDLVDIQAAEVAAVIERHRAGAQIVAVRRAGERSHPVLVSRRWYAELAAAAEGDQGGREFFARRLADTSFVDYPDPISDIDTAEDLSRALAAHRPPGQAGSAR